MLRGGSTVAPGETGEPATAEGARPLPAGLPAGFRPQGVRALPPAWRTRAAAGPHRACPSQQTEGTSPGASPAWSLDGNRVCPAQRNPGRPGALSFAATTGVSRSRQVAQAHRADESPASEASAPRPALPLLPRPTAAGPPALPRPGALFRAEETDRFHPRAVCESRGPCCAVTPIPPAGPVSRLPNPLCPFPAPGHRVGQCPPRSL